MCVIMVFVTVVCVYFVRIIKVALKWVCVCVANVKNQVIVSFFFVYYVGHRLYFTLKISYIYNISYIDLFPNHTSNMSIYATWTHWNGFICFSDFVIAAFAFVSLFVYYYHTFFPNFPSTLFSLTIFPFVRSSDFSSSFFLHHLFSCSCYFPRKCSKFEKFRTKWEKIHNPFKANQCKAPFQRVWIASLILMTLVIIISISEQHWI